MILYTSNWHWADNKCEFLVDTVDWRGKPTEENAQAPIR